MSAELPTFRPGPNIAMKVPTHQLDQTVMFYRDVLRLPPLKEFEPDVVFDFDGKRLWLDDTEYLSQAEVWLEVRCDDIEAAGDFLAAVGVTRCDHIEPLPPDFSGFWVSSPSSIIHLVSSEPV